jgi:lysophospholipase L1-like esterase
MWTNLWRIRAVGISGMIVALVANPWAFEHFIVPDRKLDSSIAWGLILVGEAGIGVIGFLLLVDPSRTWRRVLRAVVGVAFGLVLSEICLRLWVGYFASIANRQYYSRADQIDEDEYRFVPHPYFSFALNPNYVSGATSHNSLGLRGKEVSHKKGTGVYRIICFGGSTTYGWGIEDDNNTYPAQLETELQKRSKRRVEVLNAGVSGYTSYESLAQLMFKLFAFEPDLLLSFDGINDVRARLVDPKYFRSDNTAFRRSWKLPDPPLVDRFAVLRVTCRHLGCSHPPAVDQFVLARSYLGERWYGPSAERFAELFKANGPEYFRENIRMMRELSEKRNIPILFQTFPTDPSKRDSLSIPAIRSALEEHHDIIRSFDSSQRASVISLDRLFPPDPSLWLDGMHLNERGTKTQAESVLSFLLSSGYLEP